jgi:translocator protein
VKKQILGQGRNDKYGIHIIAEFSVRRNDKTSSRNEYPLCHASTPLSRTSVTDHNHGITQTPKDIQIDTGRHEFIGSFSKADTMKNTAKYPWLKIALLTVAVSVLGALTTGKRKTPRKYYEDDLKTPVWAPPGWLFGPAWTFNNFFLLRALFRLLDKNEAVSNRKVLLILQAVIWTNFFSFGWVFFKKRSPVLGAVWTQADAALALASFIIALKQDRKFAGNYAPLLIWTWFASSVAWYTAAKNPDPLLKTKPILN